MVPKIAKKPQKTGLSNTNPVIQPIRSLPLNFQHMEEYQRRLVEYTVGSVRKEVEKQAANTRRLVLVAHDKMTVQLNDGKKKSWVLDGEHPLKKKGVGQGIHVSGVICATKGYLYDAEQTMEYGKNYEGYWTGELFVKQVGFSSLVFFSFTDTELSFVKRLFLPSNNLMGQVTKHLSLSTTLRDILLIQRTLFWSLG